MKRTMEMKDLIKAFKNQIKIIFSIILIVTICGGVIGYLIPPTFEAETDLLINSIAGNSTSSTSVMSEIETNLRLIETYKQIMKSDHMIGKVNSALGNSYTKASLAGQVKIDAGNGSQIIKIIATEKTAERATTLANAYATTFQEEIKTLMKLDNITILNDVRPGIDTKSIELPLPFYIVISFISAALICLSVVIVKEIYFPFLDSKLKVEETLETPLLGTIIAPTNRRRKFRMISKSSNFFLSDEHFVRAKHEDFSKLAANIHYLTKEKSIRTIMLTSLEVGDGKTFIGFNLAIKLALNGQKTLFIDANLRKSDSRMLFNLPERKGLTSIISGYYEIDKVIQETNTDNLSFLSTGPLPPNPAQFLQSKAMAEMLDELKEQFEVIIIDTPALTKADSISLLPTVDGCIYVADASKTPEDKALQSLESIKKVGGAILGVVLNNKVKASDKIVHF